MREFRIGRMSERIHAGVTRVMGHSFIRHSLAIPLALAAEIEMRGLPCEGLCKSAADQLFEPNTRVPLVEDRLRRPAWSRRAARAGRRMAACAKTAADATVGQLWSTAKVPWPSGKSASVVRRSLQEFRIED